ncbi:Retrovirus-related Pol polyprotein from transposon TNT 1-94-like protein [Drosera capensis]
MTLVAHFDLELHQMDVKTTFLNGDIEETIYTQQPENFVSGDPKKMVCKLKKSIYGLKQASRQWYHKFHNVISSFGFEPNIVDDCIYHKFSGRIQIHRDRLKGVLALSQKGYIDKVLKRYDMQDCKPGDTPVAKGDKFSLNQCPKNDFETKEMDKTPYASAVGSLMYAQVCTRPDLAYIVGMLGRYLSNPGIDHWKAAKRVM